MRRKEDEERGRLRRRREEQDLSRRGKAESEGGRKERKGLWRRR
jgi:hypothetical protein